MVNRIIWSAKAQEDRRNILHYWTERNRSREYSKKLFGLFQEAVSLLAQHPALGSPTEFGTVRSKVVRDYQIFYEASEDILYILAIWDSRQNPEKLKEELK